MNDIDNTPTVLSRYAKAIAKVVEAGGPRPPEYLRIEEYAGDYAALLWPEKHDDHNMIDIGEYIRNDAAGTAVLEKYVREDVVVWFDGKYETHSDVYRAYQTANMYFASIERVPSGEQLFYTDKPLPHADAMIAFLEAIAEVVAGEKGMGEGTVFKNPGAFGDVHKLHPPETFGRMEINDGR